MKKAGAEGRRKATIEQVREIGWVESRLYHGNVREAVREAIVEPLAAHGIVVPEAEVEALLA